MEKRKPEEYAFPCSVIRANEKKILSKSDLERVLDSKSVQQAMNILAEFGYGEGKELANPRDFDTELRKGLKDAYDLVFNAVPDKEEIELFLYPNDYHNLKVILKSEHLGLDPEKMLSENGKFTREEILGMMRERNRIAMSTDMKEGIDEAMDYFSKSQDPQEIDIILDRACYKDMLSKALETENSFIIGYVKLSIDILNINTFVRLREIGKPWSFYQKVFLPGGNLSDRILVTSWEEAYNQLSDKLAPFGFKDAILNGAGELSLTSKFTRLEKITDNMRISYAKDAKYISFGIEPMAGYLIAKESEIKNLRMILTGKIANVPDEVTRERLRDTYV